jgi:oligopeptide transport system permease protein
MAGHETAIEAKNLTSKPILLDETRIVRRSLWLDAARRYSRNRLSMIGLGVVLVLLFLAIFADVVSPYPFNVADFSVVSVLPFTNPDHPLGTDRIGRDYMTRLIFGARTSMYLGLLVPTITFSIGITLGALAGYMGGVFDFVVQRVVEIGTAVPVLLFALMLLSIFGTGINNVIIVLCITGWIGPARLARAQFLAMREREFITAARAIGATDRNIILSHILPNALSPLLIAFTFSIPGVIFAEAGLSFLGLGIAEPTASWGQMVNSGVGNTIRVYWHLALLPTILVAVTMLSFSFVGDGLQEALDVTRSQ